MVRNLNPMILVLVVVPIIVLVIMLALLVLRSGGAAAIPEVGITATATLAAPDGETVGNATFTQGATGVLVAVEVRGLSPGGHAIAVHEVGACAPDFAAAGDHFNPGDAEHGFIHPNWKKGESPGRHGGDLPNIYAAADGAARADFFTDGFTLDVETDHSVFDADGSAIVVHEKPDAYGQEETDTGVRLACGVIQRN